MIKAKDPVSLLTKATPSNTHQTQRFVSFPKSPRSPDLHAPGEQRRRTSDLPVDEENSTKKEGVKIGVKIMGGFSVFLFG